LSWLVDEETLAQRMKEKPLEEAKADRGYRQLFLREVLQAEMGVDFDFLRKKT
jgi:dihydroxy-acid dehydratase